MYHMCVFVQLLSIIALILLCRRLPFIFNVTVFNEIIFWILILRDIFKLYTYGMCKVILLGNVFANELQSSTTRFYSSHWTKNGKISQKIITLETETDIIIIITNTQSCNFLLAHLSSLYKQLLYYICGYFYMTF